MKFNPCVSSSRRKNRKAHFNAPSHERRVIMSAPLTKRLRKMYGIRSMPIRKNDEVIIKRGRFKSVHTQPMKVISVKRPQFVINLERVNYEKTDGTLVSVNIHPSNVEITKLYLNGDRRRYIGRKSAYRFKSVRSKKATSNV